ncbi:hypothetical protein AMTR_s00100p00084880 [Amborella trichopoda]|uniref:Uncharacterized protein n=1 Tax=Amborella trichopoda TaxID=13333 RepID=W1NYG5_AMBTC|nr:hypothetical protein AMTR_s00100p00084880 [Amborella trichopoda]
MDVQNLQEGHRVIQGFNQATQQAFGSITVKLRTGKPKAYVTFQIIEIEASYNVLRRHPWLPDNGVIPSTLYETDSDEDYGIGQALIKAFEGLDIEEGVKPPITIILVSVDPEMSYQTKDGVLDYEIQRRTARGI